MKTEKLLGILLIALLLPFFSMAQLSGNYTINSAQATGGINFNSFSAFAAALTAQGVSDNVVATVQPGSGPYDEQVVFANISGLGPDATITIEGSGATITALTSTTDRYVIRLSNLQYFTINNLHIAWNPASTGGFYGIHIFGTGSHITISNCSVDMTGTTSTLYGAYIASGGNTSILETGDFHNISILNNSSVGGGYGASVFGLLSNLASNILIDGNSFESFNSNGVYLRETNGAVVSNNHFNRSAGTVSSCNAIQVAQNANINAQIFNNRIRHTQSNNGTMTFRGIYLFNGTGHRVYNNAIYDVQLTSGNVTGIEIRTGATAPEIYFNTISIDNELATTGNLYGIKEELSNTNSVLRNNIVSISQPSSGNRSALVLGATSTVTSAFNSNYNNLYVPGGNVGQRGTLTTPTFYPSLANWQTASSQDASSLAVDPQFGTPEPVPGNLLIFGAGTDIFGITSDINGNERPSPPAIGAYEASGDCPPPVAGAINGPVEVCTGSTGVVYSIDEVAGAIDYQWSVTPGGVIVSGQGTNAIAVSFDLQSPIISVVVEDSCGVSEASVFAVVVNPLPVVSLNLPFPSWCIVDGELELSGGSPEGGVYSGPGVSDGVLNPFDAGEGSHEIIYTFTDGNGCSNSASAEIQIDWCPGIEDVAANLLVQVYPNPAADFVIVNIDPSLAVDALRILDATGREVYRQAFVSNQIEITPLPKAGIYFVVLMNAGKNAALKRLIVR